MTKYETIAIIISAIALVIPLVQAMLRALVKPILEFYPTGRAYLMFNRSGSYIKVEGVFEAKRKTISVKNMQLIVKRKKDGKSLDLSWATFESPVNQRIVGAVASATELAHPFRIDEDNIVCAFTEFTDFYDSASKRLESLYKDLKIRINVEDLSNTPYDVEKTLLFKTKEWSVLENVLNDELFWQISEYDLELVVDYGSKKKIFTYSFEVSKDDFEKCQYNTKETIRSFVKDKYGLPYEFKTVQVRIR